jgi:hypothetical protein
LIEEEKRSSVNASMLQIPTKKLTKETGDRTELNLQIKYLHMNIQRQAEVEPKIPMEPVL